MLYHLLYPLSESYSFFNVFRYITVRSFIAFVIAAVVSILWGKRFIAYMKLKQFGPQIPTISQKGLMNFQGHILLGKNLYQIQENRAL